MKVFRTVMLGAALLGCSAWSVAQSYQSWNYQDREDRRAYRDGYERVRTDASSGRRFQPDIDRYREGDERRDFRDGYEAGYNSARGRDRDWNRDGYGDDRYSSDRGMMSGDRIARENGFNDGIKDGLHDRTDRHGFRPTHDDNYKNAGHGYTSLYGDKQRYKDTYRQGYEEGYQRGYNTR